MMLREEINGEYIIYAILYQHWGAMTGDFELFDFLRNMTITSGMGHPIPMYDKTANCTGCLFAQLISHFKHGPGGTYLCEPKDLGEDISYTVTVKGNSIILETRIFTGDPTSEEAKKAFIQAAKDVRDKYVPTYNDLSDYSRKLVDSLIAEGE